jgi:hypothetical protein
VRRHRTAVATGSLLGAVVLVGGVLWGADAFGTAPAPLDLSPASSSDSSGDIGVLAETPWSTLALAAGTESRAPGEKRADSVAGMICHHAAPEDDPRVAIQSADPTTSHMTVFEDCEAVWFKDGPFTSDTDASSSTEDFTGTLSAQAVIRNDSGRPLSIDRDAVFMWVETEPDTLSGASDSTYTHTVVGASMWDASGKNNALLDSADEATVIPPGGHFDEMMLASEGIGTTGQLASIIASGEPYTVTFWARIHEADPTGDATYLIQLGSAHTYGGATN